LRVLVIGLALGAVPALPAWAAEDNKDNQQNERVDKDKVPNKALEAMLTRMGPNPTHVTYHRVENGKRSLYEARFTDASGQKQRVRVAADGTFVGPDAIGETGGAVAATPQVQQAQTLEQARAEYARENSELTRYDTAIAEQDRLARNGDANAAATRDRYIRERQDIVVARERAAANLAQLDPNFRPTPVPALSTYGSYGTAAELDRARAAAARESGTGLGTGYGHETAREGAHAEAGLTPIQRDAVPHAAMETILRLADKQGGRDWQFYRVGNDDYLTRYNTKDGQYLETRVDNSGQVVFNPRPVQAGLGGREAARETGHEAVHETGHDTSLRPVQKEDVPHPVMQSVLKLADKQGARDWQFYRVGNDDYLIRYTTKDGQHLETRIDNSGQVLSQPRPVR